VEAHGATEPVVDALPRAKRKACGLIGQPDTAAEEGVALVGPLGDAVANGNRGDQEGPLKAARTLNDDRHLN